MATPLIACIPNFSEGRDAAVVSALAEAATSIGGIHLFDRTMDPDHHRCVLTFVGSPDRVGEAAFRAAAEAAKHIDLRRHDGVHPRVGATDVVPFVPIKHVSMEECVRLARSVGERIGRELQIPVFLYERAASHPDHVRLEHIRRGGLLGLAERMATDPNWKPDFGPPALHPSAGATVVGARPPLIAFNVNLQTTDLSIAKKIATTVRASGGGLPALKAIGVELKHRGLVQVSMNLVDPSVTPRDVAFAAVAREAERLGVMIEGTEVIGLTPEMVESKVNLLH